MKKTSKGRLLQRHIQVGYSTQGRVLAVLRMRME